MNHFEELNTQPMAAEVYSDINNFIFSNIDAFRAYAVVYDGLDLTVAVDNNGQSWNYQTGDNSYTGGAYGFPHWAVTTIYADSDPLDVYNEVISQLEDLLVQ